MAKNTKPPPAKIEDKAVKPAKEGLLKRIFKGTLLKILLVLLLLIMLTAAGAAAAIYFKLIDIQQLGTKWNLNKYPVIGQYFNKPETNFELVELPEETASTEPTQPAQPIQPLPVIEPNQNEKKDANFLQEQLIKQKQEEAKKIAKLARLYGGMKPEEAVAIFNQLNDETVLVIFSKMEEEQVSKILALMDPKRAARLTEEILKNKNKPSTPLNAIPN